MSSSIWGPSACCRALLFAGLCGFLPASYAQSAVSQLDWEQSNPIAQAFEAAWLRSSAQQRLTGRTRELASQSQQALSWRAGVASAGLTLQRDQSSSSAKNGFKETEISLDAPFWRPSQRGTRIEVASQATELLAAEYARSRLNVAGEVRQAHWTVVLKELVRDERLEHVEHLRQIAAIVADRVQAGDLAESDHLLAAQQLAGAEVEAGRARGQVHQARQGYETLIGRSYPSDGHREAQPEERAAQTMEVAHPIEQAHLARLAALRAQLALPADSAEVAPRVGLLLRQEQNDTTPIRRALGVQLSIPLGTSVVETPARLALQTEIAVAQAELQRAREGIASEIRARETILVDQERALDKAKEQLDFSTRRLVAIQKAFDFGELGLRALIEARLLQHESEITYLEQQSMVGLAISNLNQARGVLP